MSHGLVTDAPITRDALLALRDQPVHIVGGASAEGIAVLRLLLAFEFTNVIVHDMRPREELRKAFRTTHGAFSRQEQDALWATLEPILDNGRYDGHYLDGIGAAALVVLGQGWYLVPQNRERIVASVPASARLTSMVDLYFALHRGPIAGITGTNGKSTTVALVEHLLRTAKVRHRTAGNERSSRQFLPEIDSVQAGTWGLLEISNRQLLQTSRSPQVAAITALTPDHLDEHGGLAGYEASKARLFAHQHAKDIAIANADDAQALRAASLSPAAAAGRLVRCGTGDHASPSVTWRDGVLIAQDVPTQDGDGVRDGTFVVATAGDLQLPGVHNRRNAAVAVAVALACGADSTSIAAGLRTFRGKALRLQQLEEVGGVSVWSDIKSTTPEATVAALDALSGRRVVLIAGGDDKGLDYGPLAQAIVTSGARTLAVPGSATDKLEREVARIDASTPDTFRRVDDLEQALDRAFELAASGDCVIVSPAAAGFWTSQLQGGTSLRSLVRKRATVSKEPHQP
ncbi:MAG: UDP-N-acetylmuramoyl-L-alanyl-D-glutamate synthetase [Thermoleophilia bacterium]|nr:UDP-N-acetylmuramoyl-L-alanyl-D-glutamate synthetase [Thermoleophilia bacterium]